MRTLASLQRESDALADELVVVVVLMQVASMIDYPRAVMGTQNRCGADGCDSWRDGLAWWRLASHDMTCFTCKLSKTLDAGKDEHVHTPLLAWAVS